MSARTAALLLALLALTGCNRATIGKGAPAPAEAAAPKEKVAGSDASRRATLATTRRVDMELAPDAIAPLYNATQAACEADAAAACVVLRASLSTGPHAHADLMLRAAPAGIARLLARLRVNGGLVSEAAESEDLAAPIVDAERQLAMAREYRDSLLALRAKGSNDIKTMMAVNEELARVQSQLESATGERAHLQQRVDTETLSVSISTVGEYERSGSQPVSHALHDFGANLGEAAAAAIGFVAWAIPWSVVLLPLGWLVRRLWLRRRRAG